MTPLAEKIRYKLEITFEALDREKLTRWMMARASNKDLGILDCHGKAIGVGLGGEFDGSVRLVFWKFIKPCIDSTIHSTCDSLDDSLASYTITQRIATLDAAEGQLKGFAERVYRRMVDLDRRMRGKGYPEAVVPYDPKREITAAHELISHKFAILRLHFAQQASTGIRARGVGFWNKYWQWIIASVLVPILLALLKSLMG